MLRKCGAAIDSTTHTRPKVMNNADWKITSAPRAGSERVRWTVAGGGCMGSDTPVAHGSVLNDQLDDLCQRGFRRRALVHAAALVHDHDPVAHRHHVLQAMADEDHAGTAVAKPADEIDHLLDLPDRQRR